MKPSRPLASIVIVLVQAASAAAVVVEVPVTPEFVEQHPAKLSVRAARLDDGRYRFTIVRQLDRPAYLVADFRVRGAGRIVSELHHASFALAESETYSVTFWPEQLDESTFELSERSFAQAHGQRVPLPGGVDYVIRLKDFRRAADEARKARR